MADYREKLQDKNFQDWIKVSIGLCLTREGLLDFVMKIVVEFHKDLLTAAQSSKRIEGGCDVCTQCQKENILKCPTKGLCIIRAGVCSAHKKVDGEIRPCPNGICDILRSAIITNHSFTNPSWKNTHAEKWCEDPWEIAKCYMPPDGYLDAKSIAETDINGILSIMANLKRFDKKVSKEELYEVRAVGREIRHSPDHSVREANVNVYLDNMISFLTSSDDLSRDSTEAVRKLKKLKADDLVIATRDVSTILQDTINDSVKNPRQDSKDTSAQYMQDIKEALDNGKANESKCLSDILSLRKEVLEEIDVARRASIQQITLYQRSSPYNNEDYEKRKSDLKEDLITYYQDEHNSIPVSPLVPEHEAHILEFYVQQRMEVVELRTVPRYRRRLNSYKELFSEGNRNIYIAAQAGVGKTTFVKRLCAVWCCSQQQNVSLSDGVSESADEVMKRFDFLFLVLLADVQDEYDVDDMIDCYVIAALSRSRRYDKDFMERILHQERCLVVLDGLDEWSLQKGTSSHRICPIPHRKSRKNWTILSTSRPWKIHDAQLSRFKIDRYVELIGLDDKSARKMEKNVFRILERVNRREKQHEDFIKETIEKGINELTYTPVQLIQMACLWHDGRPLSKTKCQIYSNMIDFILQRGESKLPNVSLPSVQDNDSEHLENICLLDLKTLKRYYHYLCDVGKFAFKTLTSENMESSIAGGEAVAEDRLSNEQLQFGLHIGLLTKSTTCSSFSKHESKFAFIHQTFQEYFCAFYLATLPDDKCSEHISSMCKSIQSILEFSNVIVFLSGLCPERATTISRQLSSTIADDTLTLSFRRFIGTSIDWETRFQPMKELQSIYISCAEEVKFSCQSKEIRLCLEDFFIDNDCQNQCVHENVEMLVRMNIQTMKSVKMYDSRETGRISSFLKQYKLDQVRSLERLEIVGHLEEDELTGLLEKSAKTLKCISLCKDLRKYGRKIETKFSTPLKSLNIIKDMSNLEALMLESFSLPHSKLRDLFSCISKRHTMKQIGLGFLHCSDHEGKCSGTDIDLSEHSSLQFLQLGDIPLYDVKINTTALQKCRVGNFLSTSVTSEEVLWKVLKNLYDAKELRVLMCFDLDTPEEVSTISNILPSLEQVQTVVFKRVDFKNRSVIPPLGIKHVKLSDVQLSAAAFRTLVDRCDNIPVKFELLECDVTPRAEYQSVKSELKACESYVVWRDELLENTTEQFVFNKVLKGTLECYKY